MTNPVLDWHAMARQLKSPGVILNVLQSLLNHHTQSADLLQQIAAQGDATALRELAHKLRGTAQFLPAPALEEAASRLENALKSGQGIDPEMVSGVCHALTALLAEARNKIRGLSQDD